MMIENLLEPELGVSESQDSEVLEMVTMPSSAQSREALVVSGFKLSDEYTIVDIEPGETLTRELKAIPDQMAFKIGTVAELVGVKTYVLRFWESEFEQLHPKKSRKGQRVYSRRDVETALMIKKLLYEDRFSIEGARARLKELRLAVKATASKEAVTGPEPEAATEAVIEELKGALKRIERFKALLV